MGSLFASRAPDRIIRPAITFVIFAPGLKYVGTGTTALGWILCAVLLGADPFWLMAAKPWRNSAPLSPDRQVTVLETIAEAAGPD
jgi:hypothetical protein